MNFFTLKEEESQNVMLCTLSNHVNNLKKGVGSFARNNKQIDEKDGSFCSLCSMQASARQKEDELAQQLAELDAALSRLKRLDSGAFRSQSFSIDHVGNGAAELGTSFPSRQRQSSGLLEDIPDSPFFTRNSKKQEEKKLRTPTKANAPMHSTPVRESRRGSSTLEDHPNLAKPASSSTLSAASKPESSVSEPSPTASRSPAHASSKDEADGKHRHHPAVVGQEKSKTVAVMPSHDTPEVKSAMDDKRMRFIRVETLPRSHKVRDQPNADEVVDDAFDTPSKKEPRNEGSQVTGTEQRPAVTVLSPINENSPQLVKSVQIHSRSPADGMGGISPATRAAVKEPSRRHSSPCYSDARRPSASRRPYRLTEV